jgi:hypothetical protein
MPLVHLTAHRKGTETMGAFSVFDFKNVRVDHPLLNRCLNA